MFTPNFYYCHSEDATSTIELTIDNLMTDVNESSQISTSDSKSTYFYQSYFISSEENPPPLDDLRANLLKQEKINEIDSFSSMNKDWNGYGTEKIDQAVIDKAKGILEVLSVIPKVFPTGRNSIQFEYEKENGDYLEFEIYNDRVICLKMIEGKDDQEFRVETNSEIQKNVIDFYVR